MARPSERIGELPPVPQNIEAEAALLGALLIDNSVFDTAVEYITADDFYEPVHARIYDAIQSHIALGRIVTPVTLKPDFDGDEALQSLGGITYLARLTADGQGLMAPRELASQIANLAKLRRLYGGTMEVIRDLVDFPSVNPSDMGARLEAVAFDATASKNDRTATFTIADSIMRVVDRVKHIQTTGESVGAVAPDIPELERVIGPVERKHLHVWAARPGMGKSALMCSAARSMAQAGYGVGVVSLEMGDIDLGQRFAADVCLALGEAVLHADIRDSKLSEGQVKTLIWAAQQVETLPLKLVDTSGITIARLAMILRRMKREFEAKGQTFDVAFVDYLQLLDPDKPSGNKVTDMTFVSNALKRLAKELNVGVVALSQLSRAVEQRENKIPQMSDLRETGAIEQDADTICFLYREEYYLKNREPDRTERLREWEEWKHTMDTVRDHLDLIVPKRRGGATNRSQTTFLREYQAVRARDYLAKGGLI
jgi:replicative DNA helicase